MSTQLDFVNYDFDDLRLQLENRLKEQSAWKDTYRSATGSMIIELFAAVGNLVLYYVERRAEESYIGTAKNRSSIINLVRLLNYTPKRKVSATGTLRFTLTAGASVNQVFIPQYTECQTSGGMKYLVAVDNAVMPGQTYVDATAIQGSLLVITYASVGEANQTYNVADVSVENTHITVYVAGVLWTKVDSFIDSVASSTHYVLRPELDDTISIIFGDGVFGKIPGNGEEVQIKYIKSDGLAGNVYALGLITTCNSTIFDSDENIIDVTVSNTTTFIGGDDAETTEEIRTEAPKVFATGDRAVIRADFVSIINNYAGVADSNAWGENEENPPEYIMYNQVKLCVLLQNWAILEDRKSVV